MSFRKFSILAGTAILTLAVSCKSSNKQAAQAGAGAPPAVPVAVDTVAPGDAVYYIQYPGTVTALKEVTLLSQVSGYVTGIYFKDGQHVSQGQKLYSIDAQVYNANVQNAKAQLEVQKAGLVKAQKDAARYHQLDEQDAIAKQQVDYADAALATAERQVAAAKANLNAITANLKFTTIYAPFSGTIGISKVRVGTSVVAGQTLLNEISTDNPMAVDFNVPQEELYRFEQLKNEGTSVKNKIFSLTFGASEYPGYGSINLIDRAVDPQTGTVKIRLSFDNDKNMLKAGMTTSVKVKSENQAKAILIPHKAIIEQLGEYFVYRVTDSSTVTQTKIKLGQPIGSDIIVTDGLEAGQVIVTEGQQKLAEGAKVTIGAPSTGAPGAAAAKK
ncbi:efflux RND transporter periplasmic adaptor subunit [Arachidicoccus terrestris]|uniref:efflux RND transporter periplasmic adaptor subunit n=1 Tax=Arachidicoccus terrestris TaxID=2875539 RepID=UPI001CC59223|nr:efflux RND transporter periplasmic adaptor subunit [Arachidicoccus terrestris]UAY56398.1 efflux RND transporter periplasmic adaptor subunit [Arachidicoccus terrestris]